MTAKSGGPEVLGGSELTAGQIEALQGPHLAPKPGFGDPF